MKNFFTIILLCTAIASNLVYGQSDLDSKLLGTAAAGTIEEVKQLIELGANVNAKSDVRGREGFAPLHMAAQYNNDPEIIKLLVNKGARIDAKRKILKCTPLYIAAAENNANPQMAIALIEAGADLEPPAYQNKTPLHEASNNEIVKALIKNGAEVNVVDNYGKTALYSAIAQSEDMCKLGVSNR